MRRWLRAMGFGVAAAVGLCACAPAQGWTVAEDFESWPSSANAWGSYTNATGWVLSEGWVHIVAGRIWLAPHGGTYSAGLAKQARGTNAWLSTPRLPTGVQTVSFWLANAWVTAPAETVLAVQSSADRVSWQDAVVITNTSASWRLVTHTLNTATPVWLRIFKRSEPAGALELALDDITITAPPPVVLSNLLPEPAQPNLSDAVRFSVSAVAYPGVIPASLRLYYRFETGGAFGSLALEPAGGDVYRTQQGLPRGHVGTLQYYVACTFDEPVLAPLYLPAGGAASPASVAIASSGASVSDRQFGASARATPLQISEIMYHPAGRPDGKNLEFVELYNTEDAAQELAGFRLAGAVAYMFPTGTVLAARGYAVVAADPAAVQAVYGLSGVYGPWAGTLPNGGGSVRLRNPQGAIVLDVPYEDGPPWPVAADGTGHALTLARPDYGEGECRAWAAGGLKDGTPGFAEPMFADALSRVRINEWLAHTDLPQVDGVELYNGGTQAVDIGGCWLSDDAGTNRCRLPPRTLLPADGYLWLDQPVLGFNLSMTGDEIFLSSSNGARVVDAVRFGAQRNGQSSGRCPDGSDALRPLATLTPGAANGPERRDGVVLNELMYHPISEEDADEYIELYNRGAVATNLTDWVLMDGVSYTFPTGTTIAAGGYLVVAKDATRLLATHPALPAARVLGNYSGSLSDRGERVVLARPDDPGLPGQDYVSVDEVTYEDGWGAWTDGGGSSLELVDPRSDNAWGMNWAGSDETAKAAWGWVVCTGRLDNGNAAANSVLRELQVLLLDAGECVLDNVEVFKAGGANLVPNGTFDAGLGGWAPRGTHGRSAYAAGAGYAGGGLRIVASANGDTAPNCVEVDIAAGLAANDDDVTVRARARWLAGHRDLLLRLQGNYLEAYGALPVPGNLGTPGAVNSRYSPNSGPAVAGVTHDPVLPAAGQTVRVTCRVDDPDGVASVRLVYRVDPAATTNSVVMRDDGTTGDALAGDGVYTGLLPGQAANVTAAFHVLAADGAGRTTRLPVDATARECLVLFGQTAPAGRLGSFRLWITEATRAAWEARPSDNNELLDATVVHGRERIIYNAGVRYRGSPFVRGAGNPETATVSFVVKVPDGDRLLGVNAFNLDRLEPERDDTHLRERTCFWMARALGVPYVNQRYVHVFVNEFLKGVIYTDSHHPSRPYVESWFPDDADGAIYEIDDWFEFADDYNFQIVTATLGDYRTVNNGRKRARYRWNWERRPRSASDDDESALYSLVDAMNLAIGSVYEQRVSAIMDVDEWLRTMAVRHIAGDWDGYSYERGKNTYAYKGSEGAWQLLLWDLDFSLGGGSKAVDDDPFLCTHDGVISGKFFVHPAFRRAYWRALADAVTGPLVYERFSPYLDAQQAALTTNGIAVASTYALKTWLSQRRSYLAGRLLSVTNVAFAVTTADFTTNARPARVAGTAPVRVSTLRVGGAPYPVTWLTDTQWQLQVDLVPGLNTVEVSGADPAGTPVGSGVVRITYTGAAPAPAGYLVFNEVMYHAPSAGGDFVELYNRHATAGFALGGLRLDGVDFTFPAGSMIGPTGYVVVAENVGVYQQLYGNAEVVAGVYDGTLDDGGETLRLLQPSGTNWVVLDQFRYDDDAPWPAAAAGGGASLQAIDASQDRRHPGNWAAVPPGQGTAFTPGVRNSTAAVLAPLADVWLNELQTLNGDCLADAFGDYDPWVEVFYAGTGVQSLVGLYLTDSFTNLTRWAFPGGAQLAAGACGLVWADGEAGETQGEAWHAGFRLNPTGGVLAVVQDTGGTARVLDWVTYGILPTNAAYGRIPDGSGAWRVLHYPTAGGTNNGASLAADVWLNEFLADNATGARDPAGQYEDWIELYNGADRAADLSGYALTDDLLDPRKWRFPGGTVIPAKGFALVWADNDLSQGGLHAGFKLDKDGESLGLFAPDGTAVDTLTFGAQRTDVSEGLWPDGLAPWYAMPLPTPGAPNVLFGVNGMGVAGDDVVLAWPSGPGQTYAVDYRGSLLTGDWFTVAAGLPATGAQTVWTNTVDAARGFYRVRVEP